jgi:hypothetical protein
MRTVAQAGSARSRMTSLTPTSSARCGPFPRLTPRARPYSSTHATRAPYDFRVRKTAAAEARNARSCCPSGCRGRRRTPRTLGTTRTGRRSTARAARSTGTRWSSSLWRSTGGGSSRRRRPRSPRYGSRLADGGGVIFMRPCVIIISFLICHRKQTGGCESDFTARGDWRCGTRMWASTTSSARPWSHSGPWCARRTPPLPLPQASSAVRCQAPALPLLLLLLLPLLPLLILLLLLSLPLSCRPC